MWEVIATVAVAFVGLIVTILTANWRQTVRIEKRFTALEVKVEPLVALPVKVAVLETKMNDLREQAAVDRKPHLAVQ